MPDFDVNRYAQAWANHVKVRGDDAEAYLSAFLEQYTEDATYTDVPSGQRFAGHSALADAARHISTEARYRHRCSLGCRGRLALCDRVRSRYPPGR